MTLTKETILTPILQAIAVAALAIGAATGAVRVMNRDIPDLAVPEGPWQAGSALDGRVFHTVDTIVATGETLRDQLHFAEGRFQSLNCQQYCDFGWSEYRTKAAGDTLHFTVTARCPDAPHTVVWVGTVTGDELRFEGTWTTRRWYWTHQIRALGAGTTAAPADAVAGS